MKAKNWVVVGGGTATNCVLDSFLRLSREAHGRIDFVLPISDNGGSSSEIIRVLGGPSLGDIRSRLVRLIPTDTDNLRKIRKLLEYRLPSDAEPSKIKIEWMDIVEGTHPLWDGIDDAKKEVIRSFLVQFEHSVLARAHKDFDFRKGCIGNFFLSAMQMFFRSVQSAIFLFTSITAIPGHINVIPCIFSNSICTIAAELNDGSTILGQCEISHPASAPIRHPPSMSQLNLPTGQSSLHRAFTPTIPNFFLGIGDDNPFGEIRDRQQNHARGGNVEFNKQEISDANDDARIDRVFYINQFGQEIEPRPNRDFVTALEEADVLIYCCGSLFTSIIACLTLRDVGQTILRSVAQYKILLLNSKVDRETRGLEDAIDVLLCLKKAMDEDESIHARTNIKDFVTHMLYFEEGDFTVNKGQVESFGVKCIRIPWTGMGNPMFNDLNVEYGLRQVLSEMSEE